MDPVIRDCNGQYISEEFERQAVGIRQERINLMERDYPAFGYSVDENWNILINGLGYIPIVGSLFGAGRWLKINETAKRMLHKYFDPKKMAKRQVYYTPEQKQEFIGCLEKWKKQMRIRSVIEMLSLGVFLIPIDIGISRSGRFPQIAKKKPSLTETSEDSLE
jgi:hypothetical protein